MTSCWQLKIGHRESLHHRSSKYHKLRFESLFCSMFRGGGGKLWSKSGQLLFLTHYLIKLYWYVAMLVIYVLLLLSSCRVRVATKSMILKSRSVYPHSFQKLLTCSACLYAIPTGPFFPASTQERPPCPLHLPSQLELRLFLKPKSQDKRSLATLVM